jgi:hypothetical protein
MPKNPYWEFIQSNKIVLCDYRKISANPNIDWNTIRSHPEKSWDYYYLSQNPNITWDIVLAMPNKNWDLYSIENRTYAKIEYLPDELISEYVKNIPDYKKQYFPKLADNPYITWEIVQANPDIPWDYYNLSINPNITWEIVKANPDIPWGYRMLLLNPNITPKIINANRDKFTNIIYFQSNKLNHHEYFQSAHYKRKMTTKIHAAIYNELIMRACTPARLYQWNEGAAEEFPEEYARECLRYKAL